MTKTIRIGAAGSAMFAALGLSSAASAQETAEAEARAEILNPLTIVADGALDFGRSITDGTGGTASMTSGGVLTCTTVLCLDAGTVHSFEVTGTSGKNVTVTVNTPTLTIDNGGPTPAVDEMEVSGVAASSGTVALAGAPGALGTGTFTLGGLLTVRPNQNPGVYTGDLRVTVDYE